DGADDVGPGHRRAFFDGVRVAGKGREHVHARGRNLRLDAVAAVHRDGPAAAEIGDVAGRTDRADADDAWINGQRVAHAGAGGPLVPCRHDHENAGRAQRRGRWRERVWVATFQRRAAPRVVDDVRGFARIAAEAIAILRPGREHELHAVQVERRV